MLRPDWRHAVIAATLLIAGSARAEPAQRASSAAGYELALSPGADARIEPGRSFAVELAVSDLADGAPVSGLELRGFFEAETADTPGCTELAYGFRATGRAALGSIELQGVSILAADAAGRVALLDAVARVGGSHLRAVADLRGPLLPPVADPERGEALIARPDSGEVVRVNLLDGTVRTALRVARPAALLALEGSAGHAVLDAAGGRLILLDAQDRPRAELAVEEGPVALATAGTDRLAAYAVASGRLLLIDTARGAILWERSLPPGARALAYHPAARALMLGGAGEEAVLRLLDPAAPDAAWRVALQAPAEGVAPLADPRFAVAWSRERRMLQLVDLAAGRLLQAFHFPQGVGEVAVAPGAIYVLHADAWGIAALQTAPLATDPPGALSASRIALAGGDTLPGSHPGPLLAPLEGGPNLLVAHPPTRTLFMVTGDGTMAAPMQSVPVRALAPERLMLAVQGLRETGPGRYATTARLPRAGRYRLVLTSAARGLTQCFTVTAGDPATATPPGPELVLRLPGQPVRAGEPASIEVAVQGSAAASPAATVEIVAMQLDSNWFLRAAAAPVATDRYRATLTFPAAGTYPITAALADPAHRQRLSRQASLRVEP